MLRAGIGFGGRDVIAVARHDDHFRILNLPRVALDSLDGLKAISIRVGAVVRGISSASSMSMCDDNHGRIALTCVADAPLLDDDLLVFSCVPSILKGTGSGGETAESIFRC